MFKIFLTIYAGLEHAFEADHLLAVNTLVSHRENLKQSLKDGIFWGIGHTTTIFLVGILMIGFKLNIGENIFKNFEAGVGIMLIFLGIYRMSKLYFPKQHNHTHNTSRAAFGVGLIHGLAGSGALVVLVISQMKTPFEGLMYILIFGLGSIFGMFLAAYLFSIPYTKSLLKSKKLQASLVIISSLLCIIYGGKVVYENLFI
ncbi:MAG: HupE/UreJ family protein [Cloacibacterium sp.]|nr:HupE/UreJ family protein [Cloacibacterium sp.]MBP8084773.1 HupE/UreJ family protein [Cloacibacterium sp.]